MSEKHRNTFNHKTYISLLAILLFGLILIVVYSFVGSDSLDSGYSLVKTDISKYFIDKSSNVIIIEDEAADTLPALARDTVPKNILFFGDSMVEGLSKPFGRYAAQNGHRLTSVVWYSSSSRTWSLTDTLEYFINKVKPDFIMVSLGGNEMFVNDLSKRKQYVADISRRIGNIPFVWIGPPNWKEDTGINDILYSVVGKNRFFLSKGLEFDRGSDGRHPTPESSSEWADTISSWVMNTSCYRIRMEEPSDTTKYKGRVFVLTNAKI